MLVFKQLSTAVDYFYFQNDQTNVYAAFFDFTQLF